VHPEDRDGADTTVKEALEGRRPNFRIEFRIARPDGSVRWLVALGQVERASDGAPLRMSGINLDISELKQAEEALRQSEDRLRYALKAASAGTWDWDIVSGKAEWSPEAYVLYGRDPEDGPITYDFWLSCLHPDDCEHAKIAVSEALSGKVPEYRTEFRVVRRDGSVRWLMALGLVERDADGTPVRMSGINIDISERKHAEEALRRSEEQFRGVFENAGNGIAITDMQGQFLSCNAAYASTIGYSEEELHALKFADLIHPDDKAENLALAQSLSRQEIANFEIENRYIAKDGRAVWVHKHASLVRNAAGKPKRMIALITDITERKRQEEKIDLLMREVNHRSKNILTVVQAVARQTAASQPSDFLCCFDERVRALAASQDLLVKSEWKGADLEELIRSQLAHFKDFIDTRFVLSGPPLVVTTSTAQALGMALHELATNAGKYGALSNADGHVCIDWDLERDGGEMMFTMSWRERGGPPVQAPERRGFGSTVICRMAERSLGAEVELLYEQAGVNWRIRCPASGIVDGDRSATHQSGKLDAKEAAGFRPKILVVEDEALVGLEIEGVLCGAGFDVLGPARSVAEALQLLTASCSDGAVLDIRLGHETSEPVAKALLARRIPFVTLSGFSKEQRPSAFDGTPALMKPLEAELLIAQLKRCIGEGRAAKVT